MPIQRSQEDSWTKEMAKWESRPVLVGGTYIEPIPFEDGGRGGAPHQEYPKMLYRAELEMGGPRISATKIVHDANQEAVACGQGWCVRQDDAIADVPRRQLEMATLAANRAYSDRVMSGKAQAEAQAIDEVTMEHLPVIPEQPRRRGPGRPKGI